jgi:hypothetical protein
MHTNIKIKIFILSTLLIGCFSIVGLKVFASTNIDLTDHYAWNDIIGWIDFYSTDNVNLSGSSLTGYATSSVGYIAFDCVTSPNPPVDCATTYSNWKVTNDGSGNLSGWAWNDQIGWISFNCHDTSDNCSQSVYQVSVANGEFSGWAWNDLIGWISFNCSNNNTCADHSYKVKTTLQSTVAEASLISSVFDTGVAGGVIYNTIVYQGTKPTGTEVKFQFAALDNSSGPWNFSGYDGTDTTYYAPTGPNVPVDLNPTLYNNKRYFKYKVFLSSDSSRTLTPQVDDIIITWSR